jgi:alpha-beta hydrolase superfamily lysophospholipase
VSELDCDYRVERYTAADGRLLAAHVWAAQGAARVRAVFVHGISSHAGWYERGNRRLAEAGHEVHFLDRRGSGANEVARGDVDRWQTWLDDVTTYLRRLRKGSTTPVVLCGISWGGKLAAAVARQHSTLVDGLALICPGLYSPFEPGLVKRLLLRSPIGLALRHRRISIPLLDPQLFTDTAEWQQFIADDQHTLREITLRFARQDRTLTAYAREAAPYLTMPLLVMLAGRDRIIDNRRVREFFHRVPSVQKSLIEYPDARHTLEFELDPEPYFADLVAWIDRVASGFGAR